MLRLKRVELQGFKSFCDRTEMRFNGAGIAAIVGPNGCGKSNLSDAISWVLGEQSAKTLRGSRMEDVIFAGTRERKPLGMAAVTMTLVDPDFHNQPHATAPTNGAAGATNGTNGHQPERRHEITITRRLFRSGESEYLIDGRTARLRDIQELFLGTGLGPESYAIIEQGRIGQILSNRPQDRRAVIEEAAGIGKFKTKRRLAESKLESARQNLNRVFDILEEVSRQANSLKRQASKARRFEELKVELSAQLRRVLTGKHLLLEREAAKTALDLNLASADWQHRTTEVAQGEKDQARLQEQCFGTEAELTQARRALADLQLEAERTRGRLEHQAGQIATIEQRLAQGEAESLDLERRLEEREREKAAHAAEVATVSSETESARERLAARSAERDALQASLEERERAVEVSRQQVLRLLGEASALQNQLAQSETYLAAIDRDTARARQEESESGADLGRLAEEQIKNAARIAARREGLELIAARRSAVESELTGRREQASEAKRRLEQVTAESSRLKARKDSLEEILSHRAYTTESVQRLFTAIERGQAGDWRPVGVLADFVDVDAAYERAAEEFLHEELDYVVVESWGAADRGIELLRGDVDGRATFLVHPEPDARQRTAGAEPEIGQGGVVARLSEVLRLTNGLTRAPGDVLPRLSRCYVVADRATAQRLALEFPDAYFLLPDGVCYHGHAVSGGRKSGSGPLGLKRELRELALTAQSRQQELDAATFAVAAIDREVAALGEELEQLRGRQQDEEKEALALDHEQRKLDDEQKRATTRQAVARLELERLQFETERSVEQRRVCQESLDAREHDRRVEEWTLDWAREEIGGLETRAAEIAEEHSRLRAELAGLEERQRAAAAVEERLAAQIGELGARRREVAAEMERIGVERARLLSDNIELDARASMIALRMGESEALVVDLEGREQRLRADLVSTEEALKAMRAAVEEAREKRSQIELELVRRQTELKYLDETSRKELNASLEELAQAGEPEMDEMALAEAENKYTDVKARIEALGPVNPQALEEYQEAQQRYDFLNAQRQDLIDSIRDTEKAIQDIEVESRRRFAEAFEAINANFRQTFVTLFQGGVGEMRLTDENNAADSGVDIVASPPGKRLQNVLLLSGGERALAAMALLMAIFQYQPSPFCVLDEVDAPLDESNIMRLTRLLREMSHQTQFIVITHAKRTMEAAQALYGVTMQEPGVSKLVSVKFEPLAAAPPATQQTQAASV